jgi:hypothetical protein
MPQQEEQSSPSSSFYNSRRLKLYTSAETEHCETSKPSEVYRSKDNSRQEYRDDIQNKDAVFAVIKTTLSFEYLLCLNAIKCIRSFLTIFGRRV